MTLLRIDYEYEKRDADSQQGTCAKDDDEDGQKDEREEASDAALGLILILVLHGSLRSDGDIAESLSSGRE